MSLRPCSSCGRHVRNTETCCPFCATTLEAVAERAPIALSRVGRAAIMAFGALTSTGSMTSAAGCGGDNHMGGMDAAYGGPPPDAATVDTPTMGGLDAAYGGAPVDAAIEEDAFGGGMNLYGGPPPDDAGTAEADTGGGVPLYGGAGF